jgi:hypothetical protein
MTRFADLPEYRTGANAEAAVSTYLLGRNYAVVRVRYGGAVVPKLAVWDRQVTLPDLQALRPGSEAVWLEVKWKTGCVRFELAGEMRTGIDSRLHRDYLRVQDVTGYPVWIIFVHREEDQVRAARADRGWQRGVGTGSEMVFWPWDSLFFIDSYQQVMDTPRWFPEGPGEPLFAPADEADVQMALPLSTRATPSVKRQTRGSGLS